MDGFRVDDGVLSEHAREVDALTARLRNAAGAGTPLGLGAYGVIGQVFAVSAVDAAATASQSVAELADGGQAFGDGVRAAVRDYQEAERRVAAPFGGGR
ncbi:hypothetical protein K1T35_38810 [Pseudonocardia sp. DSM 110487]|uniref:hypothetical protein n=1 Tax=Pseudonocardia sp. DSM 110487 TaxID=2865833 RepID=UPI001C69C96D|nr:hypothetical protein [Pseudonocardia sp. DSM 110487]QYN34312.1 hypothetical protein K1T35_38810 [Pseudonocardia sp. DSM 110487]